MEAENFFWSVVSPIFTSAVIMKVWYENRYKKKYIIENNITIPTKSSYKPYATIMFSVFVIYSYIDTGKFFWTMIIAIFLGIMVDIFFIFFVPDENSQLQQKWKKSYLFTVWFRRSALRPLASSIPYIIVVIPAFIMIFFWFIGMARGEPIKTEHMLYVNGYIQKAVIGKGKSAKDYIKLLQDDGKEGVFVLQLDKKRKEMLESIKEKVTVLYRTEWMFGIYNDLYVLKLNNNFIINDNKYYQENIKKYKNIPLKIWFWTKYMIFGLGWIWLLNRKELPIHRLNRMRRYIKNKTKE